MTGSPEVWREWIQNRLERIWFHYTRNETADIEALTAEIRPVLEQYGTADQKARFFSGSVLMVFRRDRYVISKETFSYIEGFLRAAEDSGNLNEMAHAHFVRGFGRLWHGELSAAEEAFKNSMKISERIGDAVMQSRCLTYLTIVYRMVGDREQTREYAVKSLKHCEAIRMTEYVATAKANLAWLDFRNDKIQEALVYAKEALRIWASSTLAYPFQWVALWPLTAIARQEKRIADAIDHARALFHPSQQQLVSNLAAAIETAIQTWEQGNQSETIQNLDLALSIAQKQRML